jgi:hypothetical protein
LDPLPNYHLDLPDNRSLHRRRRYPATRKRREWRNDNGRPAFCVDWPHVGYFFEHSDRLNDFQLILVGRGDVSPGAFDIIFNYDQVEWETGDFDHGLDGLFGESAAVGFSSGSAVPGDSLEFPGSLQNGAFLDSNMQSGLIYGKHESGTQGSYVFPIRTGG